MDSKAPTYENDDGPAPPSYLDSLSSHSPVTSKTPGPSTLKPTSYGSQIQSQLNHLSTQFRSIQIQKSRLAHSQEAHILSLLTAHIQDYLSEFAKTGLRKGKLTLIPAQCLEKEKKVEPLDFDEDKSTYDVLVEVGDKEGHDNGGVNYWKDWDLADRLARALRPSPELPSRQPAAQKQPDTAVASQGGSSVRFWKKKSTSRPVENSSFAEDMKVASAISEPRDKVLMDVKADLALFEYENSFGLLNLQRGYAVVLLFEIVTDD
ncbi:hypothetical protein DID88_008063 [Monilinia fructigena]|uniref:Uncharacterized protein n=1 Tax=Monilinia fructigena TaxID=38457 RepID=A0A395J482_9HELO|nr:hypothetical protein DID88_008063 [Monilinia fructigena]